MTAEISSTATRAIVRIEISSEVFKHFEAIAFAEGNQLTPEERIARHLTVTLAYTDGEDAIYLPREDAREIRRLLGGRVNTSVKLVEMIRRLVTWKVCGQRVELSPARLEAVHYWLKSMQKKPEDGIPALMDMALGPLLKC